MGINRLNRLPSTTDRRGELVTIAPTDDTQHVYPLELTNTLAVTEVALATGDP